MPIEASEVVAVATNAAIALIGLVWQALLEYGPQYGLEAPTALKLGGLLADLSIQTCYGQHMDLTTRSTAPSSILSGADTLTLDQYEDLASVKSGQLGGIVCEVAALLAGAEQYRRIWRDLGTDCMTALQIKDDYTDLEEDLAAGRISHAVLFGLEVAVPVQAERIMVLLAAGRGSAPDAVNARRELVTMLKVMGADHYVLALLAVLRRRMLATLSALALPPEEYESLSRFILSIAPEYNQHPGGPASTGEQA
jgi:geranylgeranyl pyrophosphate synthase